VAAWGGGPLVKVFMDVGLDLGRLKAWLRG